MASETDERGYGVCALLSDQRVTRRYGIAKPAIATKNDGTTDGTRCSQLSGLDPCCSSIPVPRGRSFLSGYRNDPARAASNDLDAPVASGLLEKAFVDAARVLGEIIIIDLVVREHQSPARP